MRKVEVEVEVKDRIWESSGKVKGGRGGKEEESKMDGMAISMSTEEHKVQTPLCGRVRVGQTRRGQRDEGEDEEVI